MLYEYRVHYAMPDRMGDLQARFRDHNMKTFERNGMKIIGYWMATTGDYEGGLVYMVAFKDAAHRDEVWAGVRSDPEFKRVMKESEANGPLVKGPVLSGLLEPTDFSPLQ